MQLPVIDSQWETESRLLQRLKPALLSKLPYVVQTIQKPKTTDSITIYGKLQITPVPSARRLPCSKDTEKLPTLATRETHTIDTRHTIARKKLLSHPLYSSRKAQTQSRDGQKSREQSSSREKDSSKQGHYSKPQEMLPYSHVRHREIQRLQFVYDNQYSVSQIHRNYKGPNPRQVLMYHKEKKKRPMTEPFDFSEYKYPLRYLEDDDGMFSDTKKDTKMNIDLLKLIQEIEVLKIEKWNEVEKWIKRDEKRNQRSREKSCRESKEDSVNLRAKIELDLLQRKYPDEYKRILGLINQS